VIFDGRIKATSPPTRATHESVRERSDDRGRAVANGVYFYRIDAPGLEDTKKAVVTK